jgi:hypothetical protein
MRALRLVLVPLLLGACVGEVDTTLEEEVELFAKQTSGLTLTDACQKLDQLCKSTGQGCKAYSAICNVMADASLPAPPSLPSQLPSIEQLICNNLNKLCAVIPLACTIYNNKCQGTPATDGGLPLPQLPSMPDLGSWLPPLPDFGGLPGGFGFDKTKCCAALQTCIQNNDATCAAAQTDCLGVQLPSLPSLPGGNTNLQLSLLKMLHKALCTI